MERVNNLENSGFENISYSARVTRFVISMIAIVVALNSPLTGTTLFSIINLFAIALVLIAVLGWDPLVALSRRFKVTKAPFAVGHGGDYHPGHHA